MSDTRAHILIIDDDERIRQLVSRYLTENGFLVSTAVDAAHARIMLEQFVYDALIVDVMMPGETGLELTKSLQGSHDVPILLLTALGEAEDRISGFEHGADDYLPKPFEPRELILRLQAILRRKPVKKDSVESFGVGRWVYDPETGSLENDTDRMSLTTVENNLIQALARHHGEAVSREELATLCGLDAGERTIDVQVTRLRRKIEEDTKNPRYLQTVRGKGYLLRIESL